MDKYITSFIETIKFHITENNMTPTGFARNLGVKDVCVARWLNGTNTPSLEYVIMVADYLKCSVDYLLGLKDEPSFVHANTESNFAERFAMLQGESQISMNRLAKICGVTSSNVSKWMRGQMPKPQTVCFLSEHFYCSVDYLLGRSDNR